MPPTRVTPWLERQDIDDLTIVRFRFHCLTDDDDTRELFDQIYALVDEMNRTQILLNFRNIEYMATLALGKLVMLNRKLLSKNGWLGFCELTEDVRELLEVTHLADLFFIYQNEVDAIIACRTFRAHDSEG